MLKQGYVLSKAAKPMRVFVGAARIAESNLILAKMQSKPSLMRRWLSQDLELGLTRRESFALTCQNELNIAAMLVS